MKSIESIIEKEVRRWEMQRLRAQREVEKTAIYAPVITVARQYGASGEDIAQGIAEKTSFQIYDKELLEAVAQDFGVQSKLIEMLDEAARSELESWFGGMIQGRIIDSSDYVKSLTRTLGAIARHGNAVIVGRGANIILGPCRGFHIRVVGSKNVRINRTKERFGISIKQAEQIVDLHDGQRSDFVRKSFGVDVNDPSAYDLVINTDILGVSDAIDVAMHAYTEKKKYLY